MNAATSNLDSDYVASIRSPRSGLRVLRRETMACAQRAPPQPVE
jgi:hypothetical protein